MVLSVAVVISTVLTLVGQAMATTLTVGNASFEANVVPVGGEFGAGTPTPASGWWTVLNSDGINTIETYRPTAANFPGGLPAPAQGSQCLFNYSTVDNDCAVLSRSVGPNSTSITLDAGMFYTYTIAIGQGLTNPAGYFGGFSLQVGDRTEGISMVYQLEFHGTRVDNPAPGTFQNYGVVFSADDCINTGYFFDGDQLAFGLSALGTGAYADNVQVTEWSTLAQAEAAEINYGIYWNDVNQQYNQPTPEPSTLVLLAAASLSTVVYTWRRRRAA
jgi:hypothetical protein